MYYPLDPYCILLIVAGAASLLTALAVWHRRKTPGAKTSTIMMLALSWWSFTNVLELTAADLSVKLTWANVEYISITSLGALWFITARQFASRGQKPTRLQILWLMIIPFICLILAWTNDWHGLIRSSTWLDYNGSTPIVGKTYGPGFWLMIFYDYTMLLIGSVIMARTIIRSPFLYRAQAALLLVGVFLPWIGNASYLIFPRSIVRHDLTSVAFTFSAIAAALALFRFGLFDITPAAYEAVIESMSEGVLVIDLQNRIVEINQAFKNILTLEGCDLIRKPVIDYFPAWPKLLEKMANNEYINEEIVIGQADDRRFFTLQVSVLNAPDNRRIGYIVASYDMTLQRRQVEQREHLIQDLQQALGEIQTLQEMLPICTCCKKIRTDEGYWTAMEQYLSEHSGVQFTHGICPECEKKLYSELLDKN